MAASLNTARSFLLHVPDTRKATRCPSSSVAPLHLQLKGKEKANEIERNEGNPVTNHDFTRRSLISLTASLLLTTTAVQPSNAGEVGAKITKVVTTSGLGVSVRTSVVRGAQLVDKLDGKWEKFSDENGLGAARFNQEGRPQPREVPELKPLNVGLAKQLLQISDDAFIEFTGISSNILLAQIERVEGLVRKSYERSGLDLEREMTPKEFDFYCYVHFKAYCDLIVEKKLPFNRKSFELLLGDKLVPLLAPSSQTSLRELSSKQEGLKRNEKDCLVNGITVALDLTDEVMKSLVSNGLVARAERSVIDHEIITDWTEDLANIQLSIPLDGDVTLSSQVLLQEQGFRIYPDFGRFAITSAIKKSMASTNQNVSSDDYYMDTNYNSDPDLFEVKQVLLDIVIDS